MHSAIFARPEVNADRIYAVAIINWVLLEVIENIEDRLFASYRLTRYLLLFLVREALWLDAYGKKFCQNPGGFLSQKSGQERIRTCCRRVVDDIVIDLNAEVRERKDSDNPLDYKRELKSPNAVRSLARNVITQYQKSISRTRVNSFEKEWIAST